MANRSFSNIALILLLSSNSIATSNAFLNTIPQHKQPWKQSHFIPSFTDRTIVSATSGPSPEDSAKALTDYMVKSHEEKLKLLKDLEAKKDLEMKALKDELEALKASRGTSSIELSSSSAPTPLPPPPPAGSVEELQAKLTYYQQFMADYIVKSSQQKLEAVKAAELATAKKYEEKLLLLSGTSSSAGTSTSAAPKEVLVKKDTNVNPNFAERSAKLSAAAKEGKNSRWGDEEVKRANKVVSQGTPTPSTPKVPTTPTADVNVEIPKEVKEADHGLRADGGVGGLTLAERVMMGSEAASAAAVTVTSSSTGDIAPQKDTSLFEKRNAYVMKAVKDSGKHTRWGDLELKQVVAYEAQKSKALNGASVAANGAAVVNGAVDGPSLSDRVNLGAALLK